MAFSSAPIMRWASCMSSLTRWVRFRGSMRRLLSGCWSCLPATLLTQPALPFLFLNIFQEGTHLCQARAHPLPSILLILQGRSLVRERCGRSGVLSFVLRTLLGSAGVLQRLHFLVGCLQQRVDQCNACMQFHAWAPWQGVFHHGKVSRMAALVQKYAQPIACMTVF